MNKQALREYFAEQGQTKQKFGTIDCVKFVATAVKIGWGRDYIEDLQYHDRRSAVERLRGAGGLQLATCEVLGDMRPISELEPGDVIWFDRPATLGLLMPGYIAVKWGKTVHRFEIQPQMWGWRSGR